MNKQGTSAVLRASKGTALLMSFMLAGAKLVAATSDTSGSLWYTTFSGGQNIHKVDYNWVGGSLSFANNINLGPGVNGADGLLFLPNGDLAVGGQGRTVHEINPLSGAVITDLSVPTDSFHLSLSPGGKVLYSSSIPGQPTAITLNGSGGLAGATTLALPTSGTQSQLDTIAWASGGPNVGKALYTSSLAGGNGAVGNISFTGGPEAPTAATTSAPQSLPASHGLVYDPFADSFISMGAGSISRFDSAGSLLETISFRGATFDQGTVDGLGHIFAADNNGLLYMVDYSSGTLAGATSEGLFLANQLDDIAPKVGSGSNKVPDAGSTAFLGLIGLVCLGFVHKGQQCRAS